MGNYYAHHLGIDLYLVSDAERNLSLLLSQEQDMNYTQFISDNSDQPKTYPDLPKANSLGELYVI